MFITNSSMPNRALFSRATASKASSVQFEGKHTTRLAKQGLLMSTMQLWQSLQQDNNYYYGKVPERLAKVIPRNEVPKLLDTIAGQLKGQDFIQGHEYFFKHHTRSMHEKTIRAIAIGQGTSGRVYALKVKGSPTYAFKIPQPNKLGQGSLYQDVANGAFLNAHKVKDVTKLYLANPYQEWCLMEFVKPEEERSRNLKTFLSSLFKHRIGKTMEQRQFRSSDRDENPGGNVLNGIMVDLGGRLTVPTQDLLMSGQAFGEALTTRQQKMARTQNHNGWLG